eukprot:TRINITY_DN8198_c0_g1_i3.p1 TRINITY_DN8198_c0_g1~~TRINITY_DN8198_c0_g1_i3.p1  ORF type:complete len:505 (+),score=112.64 TRINITY_DN8198_c0_g1_i3:113-1627(+)
MPNERSQLLDPMGSVQSAGVKASFVAPLVFSLLAGIGALAFGYTLGYTSPIGTDLENDLHMSKSESDLFGSLVNVGAMVGALSGGFFLDFAGRRRSMFLAGLPLTGGFILIFLAKSFIMVLIGRILTGLGVGLVSVTVPVYISEIAPTELRGGLGSINQLGVTIGILVSYAIGMGVKWRLLALIGAIIPASLSVLSFFFPASPRWLYSKGLEEASAQSLRKLRGKHYHLDEEMREIDESISATKDMEDVSLMDLFRGGAGKAMTIAIILMIYQQFSGVNAVIFFSGKIFADAGMSNPNVPALIVAAVQVVVTAFAGSIVDRSGRRSLLMGAGIGMASSCAVLGYYFYEKSNGDAPNGLIAVVSLILYIFCFSLGLGAVPWLMMSEIFPVRIRGLASSFATLFNWTCSFIVTETFQSMKEALTEQGVFWFYGGICICGMLYVLFYVPETKGRSLEELERFFNGDKTAGNQHIDGAGTGGALVKFVSCLGLLYLGGVLMVANWSAA